MIIPVQLVPLSHTAITFSCYYLQFNPLMLDLTYKILGKIVGLLTMRKEGGDRCCFQLGYFSDPLSSRASPAAAAQ